MTDEYTMKYII